MKAEHQGQREFAQAIAQCKSNIAAEEEEDIKTFFIPGEQERAEEFIAKAFRRAKQIDVAAHRFTYWWVRRQMEQALDADKPVRLVVDDDLYWTQKFDTGMGRNSLYEAGVVRGLLERGLQVSYMETNGGVADPEKQDEARPYLHHNKFFIFHFPRSQGAVFAGAGNLTKAAFTKNFENFYYIAVKNEDVNVYRSFKEQYRRMWEEMATTADNMPVELHMP